jgi:hypothetical protein
MTSAQREPGTVYYVRQGAVGAFCRSPLNDAPVMFSTAEIAEAFIRFARERDLRIFPASRPVS